MFTLREPGDEEEEDHCLRLCRGRCRRIYQHRLHAQHQAALG